MLAACTAAVSVRSLLSPKVSGIKDASVASLISSSEKSPSGPMSKSRDDACIISLIDFLSPLLQCAMAFTSAVWFIILLNGVILLSFGLRLLLLCFIPEIRIFSQRSMFRCLRSLCLHNRGVISSTPNSAAFSRNHSKRSIALVGAMAICNSKFRCSSFCMFCIVISHCRKSALESFPE